MRTFAPTINLPEELLLLPSGELESCDISNDVVVDSVVSVVSNEVRVESNEVTGREANVVLSSSSCEASLDLVLVVLGTFE